MPIVNVQMLEGRSPARKLALVRALGDAVRTTLGVPDEAVRIVLTDVAPEHWGVGSRTMAELRTGGGGEEGAEG